MSAETTTPLLVFSNRHEVRGVQLPSLASRALVASLKNTIALDWRRDPADPAHVHLYWTDVVDDSIYRGTLAGTGRRHPLTPAPPASPASGTV